MEFNALVVDKDEEKNITSSQVKKLMYLNFQRGCSGKC